MRLSNGTGAPMPSMTGSTAVRASGAMRIMAPTYGHQDSVEEIPIASAHRSGGEKHHQHADHATASHRCGALEEMQVAADILADQIAPGRRRRGGECDGESPGSPRAFRRQQRPCALVGKTAVREAH